MDQFRGARSAGRDTSRSWASRRTRRRVASRNRQDVPPRGVEPGFKVSDEGSPPTRNDGSVGTVMLGMLPESHGGTAPPAHRRPDLRARAQRPRRRRRHDAAGHRREIELVLPVLPSPAPRRWRAALELGRGDPRPQPRRSGRWSPTIPASPRNGIEELLRYEAPSPVNARWVTATSVPRHDDPGRARSSSSSTAPPTATSDTSPTRDRFDVHRKIDRHLRSATARTSASARRSAGSSRASRYRRHSARFPTWDVVDDELEWVHTEHRAAASPGPIHLPVADGAAMTAPLLDGSLSLVMPAGRGPHPAVVLGAEAYGSEESVHPRRARAPRRARLRVGRAGLLPRPRADEPRRATTSSTR